MTTPSNLNVLLLGSGGREAAIAWKLAQSPLLGRLFIAPGNAGTAACGTNLAVKPLDFAAVADAVKTHGIDLVVAGNEDPLVGGLREYLAEHYPGVPMAGPAPTARASKAARTSPRTSWRATAYLRRRTSPPRRPMWPRPVPFWLHSRHPMCSKPTVWPPARA